MLDELLSQDMMPTSKPIAGGIAGLLATVIISELQNRFNITLTGDEAALLTAIVSFAAAYITPHIPPPPSVKSVP